MEINLELKSNDTIEITKLDIQYPYSISTQDVNFYNQVYWLDETTPIDYSNINKTDDKRFTLKIRRKIFIKSEKNVFTDDMDSDFLLNEKTFAYIYFSKVHNRYMIQPRMHLLPNYLFNNDLIKANETILFTLYENGSEYKYSTQNKGITIKIFMNISHSS